MSHDTEHLWGGRPIVDLVWERRALASGNPAWIAQCSQTVIDLWVAEQAARGPAPEPTLADKIAAAERDQAYWASQIDNPHWADAAQDMHAGATRYLSYLRTL